MLILGIDTSCDDTSASVVKDGKIILSNIVSSQEEIHRKYGGIVPELASRKQIEMIIPVIKEALEIASVSLDDISALAVCYGPGLVGSLLVGCCFAKALCYAKKIPLLAVNHLEGHIYTCFLGEEPPEYPFLSLIVSGGHTTLVRIDDFGKYKELGRTRDDAAGEAYDKVARLLGLGYPGGPIIDSFAQDGNPNTIAFPRALMNQGLDFSFSGLKTAVRNFIIKNSVSKNSQLLKDICASFQEAVVDVLVKKTLIALKKEGLKRLTISGGVAANNTLRKRIIKMAQEHEIKLYIPPNVLCTDNGAMIAAAGYHYYIKKRFANFELTAKASIPLECLI